MSPTAPEMAITMTGRPIDMECNEARNKCAEDRTYVGRAFGALHGIAVCQAEKIDLAEVARRWKATDPVVEGLVSDLIKRTGAQRFGSDDETLATISPHYGAFQHLLIDRSVVDGYDAIFRRAIAVGHLHERFCGAVRNSWKSRIRPFEATAETFVCRA